ncbi:MAG: DUF6512 family protein [Roseburia sp.]|nr:DUF6512 family protein [Roseburia sp.]
MNSLKRFTIIGIIFVIIAGTISHFVYEWTGNNAFAGLFFPVGESTWEHIKLLFFPMLVYSVYMTIKLRTGFPHILPALSGGLLAGSFAIPVIFYSYRGILGKDYTALDIATFAASVFLAFFTAYRLSGFRFSPAGRRLLVIAVIFLTVCFFVFTCHPPKMGIFKEPAASSRTHISFSSSSVPIYFEG